MRTHSLNQCERSAWLNLWSTLDLDHLYKIQYVVHDIVTEFSHDNLFSLIK